MHSYWVDHLSVDIMVDFDQLGSE